MRKGAWNWKCLSFSAVLALQGCFQAYSQDDGLRTIPVTNNPYVVPNHGGALPGMGSGGNQGPY